MGCVVIAEFGALFTNYNLSAIGFMYAPCTAKFECGFVEYTATRTSSAAHRAIAAIEMPAYDEKAVRVRCSLQPGVGLGHSFAAYRVSLSVT